MSFYIIVKGHLTPFDFPYLDQKGPTRIEKTRIHGEESPRVVHNVSTDVYAYQVMTKNVETLSPASKVSEAKKMMDLKKFHHVPLVIDTRLVGLISSHDIVRKPDTWDSEQTLDKLMSKTVLAVSDSAPLRHIVQVFLQENINALPVINDDLKLCGMITTRDILRWGIDKNRFQE